MLYAMHSTMLSVSVNIQLIIGYLRFICIVPEKEGCIWVHIVRGPWLNRQTSFRLHIDFD